ncbi:type II secretion system protein GspL [Polaromonas sp.]|uniref:type II secretion system protein GspL n=1 Tax=Polaromonas sp. TaxID=1869339 RepID=UPI00286D01EB|nr:type II secretion system protein GspL [Polaromonas sp.]
MSTLIIFFPTTPPGATPGYPYALTPDGRTLSDHASAPLALLPAAPRGGEVVAVVPAALLSWHSVELPRGVGTGSPRLRPILDGLLEDRLLDESAQLHLALAPGAAAGGRAWVAACDKAWLRGHLQALEAAQRPVARIVPEFAPGTGPLQLHAVGEADSAQLVVTGEGVGGVLRMPLAAATLTLLPPLSTDEELLVQAEPGVAALAEELLQRKVSLQTRPQRWLDVARSPWDLAQFDLASSGRTRTFKRLSVAARELLQAPGWRPARWGAVLLLLANLAGLNAWAWKVQSALQTRRAAVQGALTQTFPQIKLVVDAPLQMEREVALLRQATGAASGRDLEAMLAALGTALPAEMAAGSIEFTGGEARIKGLQLAAQDAAGVAGQLKSLGYSARLDGETLLLKQDLPQPEGAP